jgi:chromosome segregation ATPase
MMETPRRDEVQHTLMGPLNSLVRRTKLEEDLRESNAALHTANLEISMMKEAFRKIHVALDVANLEITELQVDFNTTRAILDDTENDLEDMKADLHDAQTKMDHAKRNLKWEKFFHGLEAADAKHEVAEASRDVADARQQAADTISLARRKSSVNCRQKRTMGTRSTPVVKRRKM